MIIEVSLVVVAVIAYGIYKKKKNFEKIAINTNSTFRNIKPKTNNNIKSILNNWKKDSFSFIIISIQFLSFFKINFNIYFIFQISFGSYLVYLNIYRSFTTIFIDYYRYESLRFNIKHALLGLISNLAIIIFLIVDYFFIYANLVNHGFISIAYALRLFFCFILLSYYANSYSFLLVHYKSLGDFFLGILLFITHWIFTTLLLNPVLEPDLFINI